MSVWPRARRARAELEHEPCAAHGAGVVVSLAGACPAAHVSPMHVRRVPARTPAHASAGRAVKPYTPRAIHLAVDHVNGQRRHLRFVQILASRGRARAVVLTLENMAGPVPFCIASGWDLDTLRWRLTSDARRRARKMATDEGLVLPETRALPPRSLRPPGQQGPPPPPDPRQRRLF